MTDLSPLVGMTPGRKVRPLPTWGGDMATWQRGRGRGRGPPASSLEGRVACDFKIKML